MLFALGNVKVEAGFLQGCLNGFLNLLQTGLLNGHFQLLVDNRLGNAFAVGCDGVHGCYLHANLFAYLQVSNFFTQTNYCGEFVAEVLVSRYGGSFEALVNAKFHLLTGFTNLVGDVLCYGAAIFHGQTFEGFEVFGLCFEGSVKDFAGEGAE